MSERKGVSLGERWRREATRGIDQKRLEQALVTLPSIRGSMVRVRPGSIQAELEGTMGSIHEVSIRVPVLASRIWPLVARLLRRSPSMIEALAAGRVPRAFDRLVSRVGGEPLFPEARRVAAACTCQSPDQPCRHVLALHELVARRLDERQWDLLTLRGLDLHALLARARSTVPDESLPPLAFGATDEPILFPEGEQGDLDQVLTQEQIAGLVGVVHARAVEVAAATIEAFVSAGSEDRVGESTKGTPPATLRDGDEPTMAAALVTPAVPFAPPPADPSAGTPAPAPRVEDQ